MALPSKSIASVVLSNARSAQSVVCLCTNRSTRINLVVWCPLIAIVRVQIEPTMSNSSESTGSTVDFLSRSRGETSSSDNGSELSDQSVVTAVNVSSKSVHAPATPASQQKRKRKQEKPAKQHDRALQEIQRWQASTENVISKRGFQRFVCFARDCPHLLPAGRSLLPSFRVCSRLVRQLLADNGADLFDQDYRITGDALLALQETAEMYMAQFFEDCRIATLHRHAITVNVRDMQFIQILRRNK